MFRLSAFLVIAALALTGCQSMKYSAWETFGVHKRDLLRSNVEDARDEQQEASEQFSDALEQLRSLYGGTGTDLEKSYDQLRAIYERSQGHAEDVRSRIKQMDRVAQDLFDEWQEELDQISSSALRADSASKLRDTRQRYASLSRSMQESSRRMDPILTRLQDQVLYLKHNLNAQSLGTLEGEAEVIREDIERLIQEMNEAIRDADSFIEQL